jgi:hypothetical protein
METTEPGYQRRISRTSRGDSKCSSRTITPF